MPRDQLAYWGQSSNPCEDPVEIQGIIVSIVEKYIFGLEANMHNFCWNFEAALANPFYRMNQLNFN